MMKKICKVGDTIKANSQEMAIVMTYVGEWTTLGHKQEWTKKRPKEETQKEYAHKMMQ